MRITYSGKFHSRNTISRTTKNAKIPDDKAQEIVDNMREWSENRYSASKSRYDMVQVINHVPAASKGKASEEVQKMQRIVNGHITTWFSVWDDT